MTLAPTGEQLAMGQALDALLENADTPAIARAWGRGEHGAGLDTWRRLGAMGLWGLLVPEAAGGMGATTMDAVVALERLGYHALPGPAIETLLLAPFLAELDPELLNRAVTGEQPLSVTDLSTSRALDADVATTFVLNGDTLETARAHHLHESIDPARRVFDVTGDGTTSFTLPRGSTETILTRASISCAALLVGTGERMLAQAVSYAGQRRQFGRVIGEYQALKHMLADVRVALDFARPLVWGAARELDTAADGAAASRGASAAKVFAADAADLAARTALQVHGAIGYTTEFDLSIWLLRTRGLVPAWGTPTHHRRRLLNALTEEN